MAPRGTPLGDAHNFGRRVVLAGDRVSKPRALLWEWLLLCAHSPLRQELGPGFDFLPTLAFHGPRVGTQGEVQRLVLEPLPPAWSEDARRELSAITGRAIALFTWLGAADLHWENLVLGVDASGRVVFGPLDVEMLLDDLDSPTHTKLVPDADPQYAALCRHAAGVRRVLPYLGKPIAPGDLLALVLAYHRTLASLDGETAAIARVFSSLPELREAPIRVCLRSTGDYVRAGREALWPPLLDAEREQLARGDIPYFFRLYGRAGIHYYLEPTLQEVGRLPLRGDVPRLPPLLDVGRELRSPNRKRLRREGLFTLLGAFDHPSLTGTHELDGLRVQLGARRIVLTLPDGDELEAKRDLRSFVGSVYLPCDCGEVRTVFVPEVTACRSVTKRP